MKETKNKCILNIEVIPIVQYLVEILDLNMYKIYDKQYNNKQKKTSHCIILNYLI